MDIKWAAKQLKKKKPVRRAAWKPGEYVGNDGSLFYCIAHEETYNSPSVTIHYDMSLEDAIADDWHAVTILPEHGYVVECKYSDYQHFVWTEKEAKKIKRKHGGTIKKVTKGLFSSSVRKS